MSIPTVDETYVKLREHMTKAQESAAMLAHLYNADASRKGQVMAKGWLAASEAIRLMNLKIVAIMQGRLN